MTKYKVVVRAQEFSKSSFPEAQALVHKLLEAGLWYMDLAKEDEP